MRLLPTRSTLFPYTTLFRSEAARVPQRPAGASRGARRVHLDLPGLWRLPTDRVRRQARVGPRSEEHTSELQSLTNLVCRLLLEKKKNGDINTQRWFLKRLRI